MIYFLCAVFIILLFVFLYFQNNIIDITRYSLKSDEVNSRVKIAHLSDLHSKPFKKVLDILYKENPDIICVTGDFINDKCKNKEKMFDFAKELINIAEVFYITGNHERRLENFEELMSELKDLGFHVLLNETAQTIVNNSNFAFLGLDENQADFKDYKARKNGTFKYQDMSKYFSLLNNSIGYKIVLSHFPENFSLVEENNYSQYDFDLMLSGHAHGGQFILPFIGPVYSPGQGLFPKFAKGSFGARPMMIVSRGLGNAEFPFRLFNHPEINIIKINPNFRG